jgi:EmrB/QacA subfamily drug resistance transporter
MSTSVKRPCEAQAWQPASPGTPTPSTPGNGTWLLVAAIVGSSMSFIDGTAVNVALPVLQRDLSASSANAQWVVEGYSLFLSALILLGGSFGDRFGRRFVYGAGIALFALASLGCALARSIEWLIAARCVQGIGAALATPGSLALISANFSGEARGRAIGTWSGFSAITSVIGPVLGGWLVQFASWRFVFLINLPLAVLVIAILRLRVGESRDDSAPRRFDVVGATLATVGLGTLVYGLIRLQATTFDGLGLAAIGGGCVALAGFIVAEARERNPMMRLDLFALRRFSAANLYTLLLYAALGGSLFFVPFDLINVQRYPPAYAGAALLPMIGIMFALSRFSGGLVARIGPRLPLGIGALLAAAGFAVFAFAGVGGSYWTTFFPGAVVLGFGGAAFVAPLTTTVLDAVDGSHAGIASGVNNAVSRTAGLIAIAALGIALAATFSTSLDRRIAGDHRLAPVSLALLQREHAGIVAGSIPPDIRSAPQGALLTAAIRHAYADGFRTAMLLAALLALLAAPIALDPSFAKNSASR